ncbi:MAG: 1-acyl-sn-glycerol-3-phosphate acyltransferase [Ruminococcus sp.]|nr:1-acyl-sn-glycerol-3-phosphate acyltransferase [Ruminococcus sp.]
MIIGDKREVVIENISKAAENGDFHTKVEVGDPVLTAEESRQIIKGYLDNTGKMSFRTKSYVARKMANLLTASLNKNTEIVGLENVENLSGGAIITSNHFSPLDNTAVRFLTRKLKKKRINIVSQETNLAMGGIIGFLMNYADIIPIADDKKYLKKDFYMILQELIEKGEYILIYPEQEMWFNYRKPRPLKRGAYFYAAKLGVPVISCFVEMQDLPEMDTEDFHKVKYTVHILPTIYPDKNKTIKDNSIEMCRLDYEQKKEAYERIYGKPLDYGFEAEDIAGWTGNSHGSYTA